MRAVVQRVKKAEVRVEGRPVGAVGKGMLVLLGVGKNDTPEDAQSLADKILNLRVFDDSTGRMNLSLLETNCELLCVSQFTLYGDCRKGRRRANATYLASHGVDKSTSLIFAIDLTPVIDPSVDVKEYTLGYIDRFAKEVSGRIAKLL